MLAECLTFEQAVVGSLLVVAMSFVIGGIVGAALYAEVLKRDE